MRGITTKLLLAVLAGTFLAPAARAIPLYFEGPGGFGFDPADPAVAALPISLGVDAGWGWETAGAPSYSPALQVTTSLSGLIGAEPMPPTFAHPLLADVRYTVVNTTGRLLDGAWLVFTRGAVDAPSAQSSDPWPFIEPPEFGLDSAGLSLVAASSYVFGAVLLPQMSPGAVHQFQLVHVVAAPLGGTVIPSPGLALLDQLGGPPAVPEPRSAVLFLAALVFAALRRRS
jgi:hypothetical protein